MRLSKSTSQTSANPASLSRAGLWVIAGLSALVFLLIHLWTLNARFLEFKWDGVSLGNFSHLLWGLAQGLPPEGASQNLFQWFRIPAILYLLAPLYRLWPSPLFLPMVQALALAVAAGTVFALGSHYLSRVRALILTLLFCFYPPIYAMSSASFHPAILAVPLLILAILSAVQRRAAGVLICAALALACDLRAGFLVLPILVWLGKTDRAQSARWWIASGLVAAAGLLGWAPLRIDQEGMGPVIFYGALTAPYLFWALCALENWTDRMLSKRSLLLAFLSPIFFAGAVCASAIMSPAIMESHPGVSQLPVRKSAMQTMIDRIPADAEVLTTPVFLPRFSNRTDVSLLGSSPSRDAAPSAAPRYALTNLGGAGADLDQAAAAANAMQPLIKKGWAPVESLGGVVLFSERPGADAKTLYSTVDLREDRPYLVFAAKAASIELVGFTMAQDAGNADIIRFSFYWRKLQANASDVYAVELSVVDADGKAVYSVNRLLCYGLYPFEDWEKGEAVKDEFSFVVPERLQNSSYEVRLQLQKQPGPRPEPLVSSVEGAIDAQGRARLIALDAI